MPKERVVPQELMEVWYEYVGASEARDSAARGYFKFQVRNAVLLGRIAEGKRTEFWDKIREIYPEFSSSSLDLDRKRKVVIEKL